MKQFTNIVITGASSGLGAALAEHYARPNVTIGILGRNQDRLDAVATKCRAKGAEVISGLVDITDTDKVMLWLKRFDSAHPIDLIIANAGVSGGTEGGVLESDDQVRNIFETNINGVLNTIQPVIPLMKTRKSGQVAIISSLAGIRGLPSAPAYSASKAAVKTYGEGLRGNLSEHNIGVSVICPGYIKTPMTDVNNFPMPFMMMPEQAAETIANGIAKNKGRVAFPLPLYAVLWLMNVLPSFVVDFIFEKLPGKPAMPVDRSHNSEIISQKAED